MLGDYERRLLKTYQNAITDLAELVSQATGQVFDPQVEAIVESIDNSVDALERKEDYEILSGNGPVARMLSIVQAPAHIQKRKINLFEYYGKDVARSYEKDVVALLAEFFPKTFTNFVEGTEEKPNLDNLRLLPTSASDWKPGFYFEDHDKRVVACIKITEPTLSYLLVRQPFGDDEQAELEWVSWVSLEQRWIKHRHSEIFSYAKLRKAVMDFATFHIAPLPEAIALTLLDQQLDWIAARVQFDKVVDDCLLNVRIDNYSLSVAWTNRGWVKSIVVDVGSEIVKKRWVELSKYKQNQFYDRLCNEYPKHLLTS